MPKLRAFISLVPSLCLDTIKTFIVRQIPSAFKFAAVLIKRAYGKGVADVPGADLPAALSGRSRLLCV
jgi:hypothetical protein